MGHRREVCPFTVTDLKQAPVVEKPDSPSDLADSSGESAGCSQEAGKEECELKGDGKVAYGPWIFVNRRKSGAKQVGSRSTYKGGDVGPDRGQFRYEEKLAKASSIAREEFPYEVSAGSDQELMGAGGRMSHSPLASTVNLKSNPTFPVQRPLSSQRTQKQETKLPAFSFGAEINPKPSATACPLGIGDPEARCASSASGFVGSGLRGNGDGRNGRPEQARVGNLQKGKNHGGISKHAGTNKSKPHHDLGLVRVGGDAGMEADFPSKSGEQKGGVAAPVGPSVDGMGVSMVDFSVRQANEGGSKNFRVESAISAISGAKLEGLGPRGRGRGKESLAVQDGGSDVLGKRNFQDSASGGSKSWGVKSIDNVKGGTDGNSATLDDPCTGRGYLQGSVEGVRMEVSEQDGHSEST